MKPLAASIDLGSTRLKSAVLADDGSLVAAGELPAPPLEGTGEIREGDGAAYAEAAETLLDGLSRALPCGTPLGLTSQRSSFLLWDSASAEPLTPLVSWQDRRAADWCRRHAEAAPEVTRRTGLVLNAHYIGPKLATLGAAPRWRSLLDDERTRLGTLDSYVVWRRTRERRHEVDPTMAARSAMFDLERGDWSEELLALYGVPRAVLPRVRPTVGFALALDGGLVLRATIADQPAGLLPLAAESAPVTVITLGTGAFVQRLIARREPARAGYLLAPILVSADGASRYCHEATINGAGSAVDRFGEGPTALPEDDPAPEALCLPDLAGLGSPHWRADLGLTFTAAAEGLALADQRRIVLEGVLFRLRQVLEDLGSVEGQRLLLVGGLAREPFLARGLAALLGRPVERAEVHDAGLLGAARLAAGLPPAVTVRTERVEPEPAGAYLSRKYPRWRSWLRGFT